MNNFSYFEISAFLFYVLYLKNLKLNKRCGALIAENMVFRRSLILEVSHGIEN